MDVDVNEIAQWRRDLHAHPELLYDLPRTSAFVADRLRSFGCDEVVTGIGRSGVVGVVHGAARASGRVIGLRADMDALPLQEETGLPHASTVPGRMHACGHDGHTAMLLGAVQQLTRTRRFDGTMVAIFQPAEEGGGGGRAMCEDGLMDRFGIDEVYALHTEPGLPIGHFATAPGPIAASADGFRISVEGKGAHGASPHASVDPLVAGASILLSLQTIVARNVHPMKQAVVPVGTFAGGTAGNVIPARADLGGTTRPFEPAVRDLLEQRVTEIAQRTAEAHGATARVAYRRMYPPVVNTARETAFALVCARTVAAAGAARDDLAPLMGSEDFAFMLEERPGNITLIGNGDTPGFHDTRYDFDDAALPYGIVYFCRLIETGMPVSDG
jgi:hippurate hydrolase